MNAVRPGQVKWFNGEKTMGWKSSFGGLALLLMILVGCKGRVFLTEDQSNIYKGPVPSNLQEDPNVGAEPTSKMDGAPPTLSNLERQIRYLSLSEAVAISLEQGTVGQPSLLFPGIGLDNLIAAPQGSPPQGSDSIRVLAMDPATTAANIDASLAKFDAVLFLNTTGDCLAPRNGKLSADEEAALEMRKKNLLDFVKGGKGFAGFHSATDTFYSWKDYGEMIGGWFTNHPWHQDVPIKMYLRRKSRDERPELGVEETVEKTRPVRKQSTERQRSKQTKDSELWQDL